MSFTNDCIINRQYASHLEPNIQNVCNMHYVNYSPIWGIFYRLLPYYYPFLQLLA